MSYSELGGPLCVAADVMRHGRQPYICGSSHVHGTDSET